MADVTSETLYLRPIPCVGEPVGALPLGGGGVRFSEVEIRRRSGPAERLPAAAIPELVPDGAQRMGLLTAPRQPIAGCALHRPNVMGVVNVTPDSFSDGGQLASAEAAIEHGFSLVEQGADLLDIGGESTRPGAAPVSVAEELGRVMPVIEGLLRKGCPVPISVDTRKAEVARDALGAGAVIFNDVSALTFEPGNLAAAQAADAICLMHAKGTPATMQTDPQYDDVVLDVYDFLADRVAAAEADGIPRDRLIVDPGIGFGKTLEHNLALLRALSIFQGFGCAVLLGVSRKRFLGTLSGVAAASERVAPSVAGAIWGVGQGAQILRVHDVAATVQALKVWQALARDPGAAADGG